MSRSASAYSAFAALLSNAGQSVSPAELHGLLLGRTCAGAGFDRDSWLACASEMLDLDSDERIAQALAGLQLMLKTELESGELSLVLLLPDDESSLAERTAALGQWCQGFLTGFGLAVGDREVAGEVREILLDLADIAQIADAEDESEAGEHDYMEVMEYLRVAPLNLLAACGGLPGVTAATPGDDIQKPSLH